MYSDECSMYSDVQVCILINMTSLTFQVQNAGTKQYQMVKTEYIIVHIGIYGQSTLLIKVCTLTYWMYQDIPYLTLIHCSTYILVCICTSHEIIYKNILVCTFHQSIYQVHTSAYTGIITQVLQVTSMNSFIPCG
jgi:hypothetical protein